MNATDTPTYQVRISHPSGVSHEQIQEFLDNGTILQDLCLEQAIISSTQLYALGYKADSVKVGLANPSDESAEILILFLATIAVTDDITAMNLLDSLQENVCEHTKVSIQPTDEKGLSEIDLDTDNTDEKDD